MTKELKKVFNIAKEFSKYPGPRYKEEGSYSGQELREDFLLNVVENSIMGKKQLLIDLDGTRGYGTSFLEEVFGGLIRENNIDLEEFKKYITFKSDEEDYLIEDIEEYMDDANNENSKK